MVYIVWPLILGYRMFDAVASTYLPVRDEIQAEPTLSKDDEQQQFVDSWKYGATGEDWEGAPGEPWEGAPGEDAWASYQSAEDPIHQMKRGRSAKSAKDSWKQQQPLEADNIAIDFFEDEDAFLGSQEMKRVMSLAKEAADKKRKRKTREEYKSEGLAAEETDAAWSSAIQAAGGKMKRKSREVAEEDAATAAIQAADKKKMKKKKREAEIGGLAGQEDAATAAIEVSDKKKMKNKTREVEN